MDYSLTSEDMQNWLDLNNIQSQVLTYPDLSNFLMLEDLLANGPVVILYFTHENYGHWTCLFENKQGIQFFDSYGLEPDMELDWEIDDYFRKKYKEDVAHLSYLLYEFINRTGISIRYNDYPFQAKGKYIIIEQDSKGKYTENKISIATCGRHVLTRIFNNYLSDDKYIEYIIYNCDKYNITPDQYVTKFTGSF